MNQQLNGIFSHLDINDKTGLASENNIESLTAFQRLFYEQAKSKIGVDAVYFLRDEEGIAKIPLIYFSMLQGDDAAKARYYTVYLGTWVKHRYVTCKCSAYAVDGGHDYLRKSFRDKDCYIDLSET